MQEGDGREYLPPKDAARFLRLSKSTVLKWRREGKLPNTRGWTRETLKSAWKAHCEQPPSPPRFVPGQSAKKSETAAPSSPPVAPSAPKITEPVQPSSNKITEASPGSLDLELPKPPARSKKPATTPKNSPAPKKPSASSEPPPAAPEAPESTRSAVEELGDMFK